MIQVILPALCSLVIGTSSDTTPPKENPGSLYGTQTVNPLHDRVARQVGDIVSVLIQEQSLSTFAAATKTQKSDNNSITLDSPLSLLNGLFRPFTTGSNGSSQGSGDTSQKSSMTARMSVIVKQILPNGNMAIEGKRSLVTNKQTQTFVLSGTIRPFDIKPDNTIDSSKIADAQIRMEGQGAIADRQRKGVITQIIDWLF
ncbi:MAG: flagellar basal body L-ring protein FlgH [Fimbriimonadaceae bacterium]|nr:flagellar basal body L-ring protein FlgH [Fimbriimonadaceae bacterium]